MSDLGLGALSRDRLIARIEALEAAGKRLAEAITDPMTDNQCQALAAWRKAEKGGGDETHR